MTIDDLTNISEKKDEKLTEITKREFEENYLVYIEKLENIERKSEYNLEKAVKIYRKYVYEERRNIIKYFINEKGYLLYTRQQRDTIGFKKNDKTL